MPAIPKRPGSHERKYGIGARPRPVQPQLEVHHSERKDKVLYGPKGEVIVRIVDRPIGFTPPHRGPRGPQPGGDTERGSPPPAAPRSRR